jgi:hypothetical protein
MAQQYGLHLSDQQRRELEQARDHHAKAYVRERAAAVLRVSAGRSIRDVAANGALKERHRDTVCGWVHRYEVEGLAGLMVKPGRGRKPAFSPSVRGGRPRASAKRRAKTA